MGDSFYFSLGYLMVEILSFYLVFFLSNDLTKRLQSVKVLYDEILLNLGEGMLIIDQQNRIQFINQEALELFRFEDRGSLQGQYLEDIFRRTSDEELKNLLSLSENVKQEILFNLSPTEDLPLEIKSSIIRDEKGSKRFSVVICHDLSLQKRALETGIRLTKLEAIREMSAEIAHEIKNPLASILGSTQELAKIKMSDAIYKKLINIVCEETERINDIVEGFLKFARIPPTKLEKCCLSTILEEIVIMLQHRIASPHVTIEKYISPGLFCEGDKSQLKQLFLNLGINALEAIVGSGNVSITAKLDKSTCHYNGIAPDRRRIGEQKDIEVSISDSGSGIDPELVEEIFKPFFTTKSKGTGMGLSIVDWIIHAHNAAITWKSEKNRGTTFTMKFPAIYTEE